MQRIHDEAVEAAREYWEEKAGRTRRGQGGREIESASLVFACFEHITSRALDPQLHTHVLILHLAIREDGTSGALHNHELFVHRTRADMIYKVHLALGLRLELGLKLEEEKPAFRIVGVPKEVCEAFSTRRVAIREHMKANGLEGAVASNIAALATRSAKRQMAREDLFLKWQEVGRAMGWGPEQARNLGQDKMVREILARLNKASNEGAADSQSSSKYINSRDDGPAGLVYRDPSPMEGVESKAGLSTSGRRRRPRVEFAAQADSFVLKHRRWGDILWHQKLGVVELRIQRVRPFRKAWRLNPASKVEIPAIRIVPRRITLFDPVPPHKRPKPKILWAKDFLLGEIRAQKEQIFPRLPAWSPGVNLTIPVLRFGRRSGQSGWAAEGRKTSRKVASEITQSQ